MGLRQSLTRCQLNHLIDCAIDVILTIAPLRLDCSARRPQLALHHFKSSRLQRFFTAGPWMTFPSISYCDP
jgi:hypothetical protein